MNATATLIGIGDQPLAGSAASDAVSVRHWVALLGAMLGAFMAVLDIQITNASLNDILGSLGATLEEGSWISTSYLVAEIIVIPLTGWLSDVFSAAALPGGERRAVSGFLRRLRVGVEPGEHDRVSRTTRVYRGRAHPDGFQPRSEAPATGEARVGVCAVRHDGDLRACDRANRGRLADRQLRLAGHFLPESPARRAADHGGGVGT